MRQIFSIRGLSALFLGLALLGTATPSLGQAQRSLGASGTPSFFINGKRLSGLGIESFDAAIEGKPEPEPAPNG